jgi:type I restriction enzyme S subunit
MEKLKGKKPIIRFPEFKDDWQHTKLSELLSEAKKRNEDLKYGRDEVLSVSGELGIVNQIEHLGRSYAGASVHNYHVVETGDIVYTKSPLKANPFGIIKLNKGKAGIVSTLYAVYKVNNKTCYGPWLDYYFSLDANTNRYLRPLVKKGAKNDMKINNAYVLHDRIFTPSIPEQKRIASFFTVVDKKIAELKQKKALLDQYKKGVMQKLFSQELRFKDENGKEFPKWEKKNLGSIGDTFTGLNGKSKENFGEGKPYIQYKQIFDSSRVDINKCDFVEIEENENQSQVKFGDVFFTTSSETPLEIGYSSVLLQEVEEVYLNSFCFGYRIHSFKVLNPHFAEYLFRSPNFRKDIIKLGQGSTRYNMSKTELMKVEVILPSEKEQKKIYQFLNEIDDKIKQVTIQIDNAVSYRKGLLQNMFCNG